MCPRYECICTAGLGVVGPGFCVPPGALAPLCACMCNQVPTPCPGLHQVFFCIVGTLVAAAVIVHEGDYTGYHKSLAERGVKGAAAKVQLAAGGYRTTPGTLDPFQYIRTGHYAKILAREDTVARDAKSGLFHETQHLTLDRWLEVNNPTLYQKELKQAAEAKLERKADQGRGAPERAGHLNVAGVKPHVKQPSLQNNAMNPIAASGPGADWYGQWLGH